MCEWQFAPPVAGSFVLQGTGRCEEGWEGCEGGSADSDGGEMGRTEEGWRRDGIGEMGGMMGMMDFRGFLIARLGCRAW